MGLRHSIIQHLIIFTCSNLNYDGNPNLNGLIQIQKYIFLKWVLKSFGVKSLVSLNDTNSIMYIHFNRLGMINHEHVFIPFHKIIWPICWIFLIENRLCETSILFHNLLSVLWKRSIEQEQTKFQKLSSYSTNWKAHFHYQKQE